MSGNTATRHPASYRDPCGYVFNHNGVYLRAVLTPGQRDYEHLIQSGLYEKLTAKGLMLKHEEVGNPFGIVAYKTLKPEQLSFWTYPYEWSFNQLKDAALLTLRLLTIGLEHGMILKDASAYNIQFVSGKPVLIDSLSFEVYEEGKQWQAFNQFCRHFLYPLLLIRQSAELLPSVLAAYPDGIPVQLTADLLPWKNRLNWNNQLYVYLAAALSRKQEGEAKRTLKISRQKILQNVTQLRDYIRKLQPKAARPTWSNYYEETILSKEYLENKKAVVADLLSRLSPNRVVDAGCNTGAFSLLAASTASEVIAFDFDAASVDALYTEAAKQKVTNLHLLVGDINNPTPSLGWANAERSALTDRVKGDLVLSLALVHHLALAKNVPLSFISAFLAKLTTKDLVIEFVPKSDPKAQLLLQSREDIFTGYTVEGFESAFQEHFDIIKRIPLAHSERVLYLMQRK